MFLYKITNYVNGKEYIGISKSPSKRWLNHKGGRGSKLVYQAIRKYGLENIKFDVLYTGCEEDICQLEIDLIAQRQTEAPHGYNLTAGGSGLPNLRDGKNPRAKKLRINGVWFSCIKEAAEALGVCRAVLAKRLKEATTSSFEFVPFDREEHSRKSGLRSKGRKHTPEAKEKMSKKRKRGKHCCARKILVNGNKYECIRDAAEGENINYSTLRDMIRKYNKSHIWPLGWAYLTS